MDKKDSTTFFLPNMIKFDSKNKFKKLHKKRLK